MRHPGFLKFTFLLAVLTAGSAFATTFTITPTFDSTITNDSHAAAIEATINSAISIYESDFLDPINVNITFKEDGTSLGDSSASAFIETYSNFHSWLTADAKTADDGTAIARLNLDGSVSDPVPGSGNDVIIKSANLKALGQANPNGANASDGTIGFNASEITLEGGSYNLQPVLEHEIDEVLGLGSTFGSYDSSLYADPSPEDFFRYSLYSGTGNGVRNYTAAASGGDSSKYAFFSIDGKSDLAEFDSFVDGGDYGDWEGPYNTVVRVQDAFASPGTNPTLGVELRALDVIGYDLAPGAPEPGTVVLFISGLGLLAAARRKLRA